MTPSTKAALNRAIAEKLGWKIDPKMTDSIWKWIEPNGMAWRTEFMMPKYTDDLNACHEAEKALSHDEAILYRHRLMMNSDGPNHTHPTVEAALCHATAEERAQTLSKVWGLKIEEEKV